MNSKFATGKSHSPKLLSPQEIKLSNSRFSTRKTKLPKRGRKSPQVLDRNQSFWEVTRAEQRKTLFYFLWWTSFCHRPSSLRPHCSWHYKGKPRFDHNVISKKSLVQEKECRLRKSNNTFRMLWHATQLWLVLTVNEDLAGTVTGSPLNSKSIRSTKLLIQSSAKQLEWRNTTNGAEKSWWDFPRNGK